MGQDSEHSGSGEPTDEENPRGNGDPSRGEPAPEAPHGGRSLVRVAGWFYASVLGAALLWGLLAGRSIFYAEASAGAARLDPIRDPMVGLLAAGIVILVSDRVTRATGWGDALARELGAVLGRPSLLQCILLALLSGVAEEAFFRGALQPAVGLVGASLLFGLAHFVPRRELLPWTGFAVAAGFLLGVLFDATGNLIAPVVAHIGINAVNLRLLTQRYGPAPVA